MAASTKHVLTNVERMTGDTELLALWNREAQGKNDDGTERTVQEAWLAFVQAADAARIADRIPGTTGRTYTAKYAAEPEPKSKPVAKRSTAAKNAASK
jgi:hypothetical protein